MINLIKLIFLQDSKNLFLFNKDIFAKYFYRSNNFFYQFQSKKDNK